MRSRERLCNNPAPVNGGKDCIVLNENHIQTSSCTGPLKTCPGIILIKKISIFSIIIVKQKDAYQVNIFLVLWDLYFFAPSKSNVSSGYNYYLLNMTEVVQLLEIILRRSLCSPFYSQRRKKAFCRFSSSWVWIFLLLEFSSKSCNAATLGFVS